MTFGTFLDVTSKAMTSGSKTALFRLEIWTCWTRNARKHKTLRTPNRAAGMNEPFQIVHAGSTLETTYKNSIMCPFPRTRPEVSWVFQNKILIIHKN